MTVQHEVFNTSNSLIFLFYPRKEYKGIYYVYGKLDLLGVPDNGRLG